jgi:hypothetical protein
MRMLGAFLSLLVVSSAATATESNRAEIAVYHAEHAVSGRLQNPYRAEFRNVSAYRPDASIHTPQAVCGEVRAGSGLDLYNGYRTFVWLPADANTNPNIDRGTVFIGGEANSVLSLCRNAMR